MCEGQRLGVLFWEGMDPKNPWVFHGFVGGHPGYGILGWFLMGIYKCIGQDTKKRGVFFGKGFVSEKNIEQYILGYVFIDIPIFLHGFDTIFDGVEISLRNMDSVFKKKELPSPVLSLKP